MPVTRKEDAKVGGWKAVRQNIKAFEGDVISATFDQWGSQDGKIREYLEVNCVNVNILETEGELPFIPTELSFRVNCSDYQGSFWVDVFLEYADRHKILIPEGLVGKRIRWKKVSKEFNLDDGTVVKSDFVIDAVLDNAAQPAPPSDEDILNEMLELAVGKTEQQFRSAASLNPRFANSPLLALAKSGAITSSFVSSGKLVLVKEGNKEVYRKP